MTTRSLIGIENADGSIEYIYCHYDGYLEHNGKILKENYFLEEKVRELISLGDLSSLREEIGGQHDFGNCPDGVCNFYGRDRGEEWEDVKPQKEFGRNGFLSGGYYYNYLFSDGKWLVSIGQKDFKEY